MIIVAIESYDQQILLRIEVFLFLFCTHKSIQSTIKIVDQCDAIGFYHCHFYLIDIVCLIGTFAGDDRLQSDLVYVVVVGEKLIATSDRSTTTLEQQLRT